MPLELDVVVKRLDVLFRELSTTNTNLISKFSSLLLHPPQNKGVV